MLSSGGKFFSSSFWVFEMLIFGKLMKRRFQWYIGLPTFFLLFLLCVQLSKNCREGSILMEPPPPLILLDVKQCHAIKYKG